ncbi:MAG: apolipoprotein N-acyltransferase [Candidatus Eremiobacteraeota bacterium]|nr:apolipoprotein N-acyltransferase [Candidatus Eremiobacteraeota bacterium]
MAAVTARRSFVDTQPRPQLLWPVALAASLAGPLLLSLAFPMINFGLVSLIALVPLFLVWSKASWKQALWWGWLAGTVMFILLINWMMHSIGDFVGSWSIVALVLLSAYEGLFVAASAVLASLIGRGEFRPISVVALPAAWLLLENVRTRGSLGVPFGELGLAAAHLPWLLPLAAYGGVYLLSAIIALANGAVAGLIGGTPAARRTSAIVLAALVLLVAAGSAARQGVAIEPRTLRVGIAQGNISQREKWTPAIFERTLEIYTALTRQAVARGATIVVWPETAVTSYPLQQPWLLTRLESVAATNHAWIMAGTVDRPSPDGLFNALLELTPAGTVGGVYHKRFLVPFAEYLPLDRLLRRLPLLDSASHFVSGPGPHLLPAAGWWWGTLICYESAYAPYARATANAGADALIIATDDAWFGGTSGPYQHADVAVVDAVSTGRFVVRGADTGISEIIDPKGTIVARLGLGEQGIVVGDIGRGTVTPYDRHGVFWLLFFALLALLAGLWPLPSRDVGWRSRRGAS